MKQWSITAEVNGRKARVETVTVYAGTPHEARSAARRLLRRDNDKVRFKAVKLVGHENLKTYADLDMKAIRDACGLDFAHFTYLENMCSCCYGPEDMPKRYWKDGVVQTGSDYTFILGKNANNGSGTVQKIDPIVNGTYFAHRFKSAAQKEQVCRMLAQQPGVAGRRPKG